jgi:Carboxypeptidase regulatory-like domain
MLLAVTATACGDGRATSTTPPAAANVSGVVLAGPTCPVVTPEEPCPPRPVTDAVIEAQRASGQVVANTHTDADGRYALTVGSGTYTLIATTSPGGPLCDPVSVTVSAGNGSTVQADISCDTGIR